MLDLHNGTRITMAAGPNTIHDRIRRAYSRQIR